MAASRESPKMRAAGAGAGVVKKLSPEKSSSFHGHPPTEHRALRRPNTQPDLRDGRRAAAGGGEAAATPPPFPPPAQARRVPSKVLVNVMVQRSLGPVQVLASTDWTVADLVAAALQQYGKEGRRPPLPPAKAAAFALHYSQFSLECLDPGETLVGLGSRNFFLCPQPTAAAAAAAAAPGGEKTCSAGSAPAAKEKPSKVSMTSRWRHLMDFLQ